NLSRLRNPNFSMTKNNPIYKRELLLQRRYVPRHIQMADSVGIIGCAFVLSMLLILHMLNELASTLDNVSELMQWVQLSSWFIHILVVTRTILAGVEVIQRDVIS